MSKTPSVTEDSTAGVDGFTAGAGAGAGGERDEPSYTSSHSSSSDSSPPKLPKSISEIIKRYGPKLIIRRAGSSLNFFLNRDEDDEYARPYRTNKEVVRAFHSAIISFFGERDSKFNPEEVERHSTYIHFINPELLDLWIKESAILIDKSPRDIKKIVVVGAGDLAKNITNELVEFHKRSELPCEIVIINRNTTSIESILAEVTTTPFISLKASDNLGDMKEAAVIINTAGVKLGLTGARSREDPTTIEYNLDPLYKFSLALKQIIKEGSPMPWVVNLVNPVEHFSGIIKLVSGIDPERIIGSGAQLDAKRFCESLGKKLKPYHLGGKLEVVVVGSHIGDSMIPLKSTLTINDTLLQNRVNLGMITQESLDRIFRESTEEIQNAGIKIARSRIDGRGPSNLPSQATFELIVQLLYGESPKLLSASVYTEKYGDGKYLALPILVSQDNLKPLNLISDELESIGDKGAIVASKEELLKLQRVADSFIPIKISDLDLKRSQELNEQLQRSREKAKVKLLRKNEMRAKIPHMTDDDLSNPDFKRMLHKLFSVKQTTSGDFHIFVNEKEELSADSLLRDIKSGLENAGLISRDPDAAVLLNSTTRKYFFPVKINETTAEFFKDFYLPSISPTPTPSASTALPISIPAVVGVGVGF